MPGVIVIVILIVALLYEFISRVYAEVKAKQINDAYKKLIESFKNESTKE